MLIDRASRMLLDKVAKVGWRNLRMNDAGTQNKWLGSLGDVGLDDVMLVGELAMSLESKASPAGDDETGESRVGEPVFGSEPEA